MRERERERERQREERERKRRYDVAQIGAAVSSLTRTVMADILL